MLGKDILYNSYSSRGGIRTHAVLVNSQAPYHLATLEKQCRVRPHDRTLSIAFPCVEIPHNNLGRSNRIRTYIIRVEAGCSSPLSYTPVAGVAGLEPAQTGLGNRCPSFGRHSQLRVFFACA